MRWRKKKKTTSICRWGQYIIIIHFVVIIHSARCAYYDTNITPTGCTFYYNLTHPCTCLSAYIELCRRLEQIRTVNMICSTLQRTRGKVDSGHKMYEHEGRWHTLHTSSTIGTRTPRKVNIQLWPINEFEESSHPYIYERMRARLYAAETGTQPVTRRVEDE